MADGLLGRVGDLLLLALLEGAAAILRALPARWVLRLGDLVGEAIVLLERRARVVGHQNLDVAFGDALTRAEKRRLLRASSRGAARAVLHMIHVSPMTPERLARWVVVAPGTREAFVQSSDGGRRGGVLVSGHVGNWELLLGANALFAGLPTIRYLAEDVAHPVFDRFLNRLRGSGGSEPARRKGGARALQSHVARGGAAALLVDRNVVRIQGGVWAPFLGLPARTTPLPAWLALRNDCHVRLITCLPRPDGRVRLEVGPNLAEGPFQGDRERDLVLLTERINQALEAVIRRHPEAWNWTLKRFKSRPTQALGPYPPYSLWDPDPVTETP